MVVTLACSQCYRTWYYLGEEVDLVSVTIYVSSVCIISHMLRRLAGSLGRLRLAVGVGVFVMLSSCLFAVAVYQMAGTSLSGDVDEAKSDAGAFFLTGLLYTTQLFMSPWLCLRPTSDETAGSTVPQIQERAGIEAASLVHRRPDFGEEDDDELEDEFDADGRYENNGTRPTIIEQKHSAKWVKFAALSMLLLVVLSVIAPLFVSQDTPAEKRALKELFDATGGAANGERRTWVEQGRWGHSKLSMCTWGGVQCSGPLLFGTHHVTSILGLSGNGLLGPIPNTLSTLTSLTSLDLSSNDLTGSVPATIGSLVSLRLLDVSSNPRMHGALPESLCTMPALQYLAVSCNHTLPNCLIKKCTSGALLCCGGPQTSSNSSNLAACLEFTSQHTGAEVAMCADISLTATISISVSRSAHYPARVFGNGFSIRGRGSVQLFAVGEYGALEFRNMTLQGGYSSSGGGAVYVFCGSLTTTSTTFTSNSASYGGAVYVDGGSLTTTSTTFTSNSASYGGAVYAEWGSLMTTSTTFTSNSALNGGAVYMEDWSLNTTSTTFTSNIASNGGAVYVWYGSLTTTSTTFTSNSASWDGGAVYVESGDLTATSTTFSGNNSSDGGDVFNCYYGGGAVKCASACSTDDDGGCCTAVECFDCACYSCDCEWVLGHP